MGFYYDDLSKVYMDISTITTDLRSLFTVMPRLSDFQNMNSLIYNRTFFELLTNYDVSLSNSCKHCNGTGFEHSALEDSESNKSFSRFLNCLNSKFLNYGMNSASLLGNPYSYSNYWSGFGNLYDPFLYRPWQPNVSMLSTLINNKNSKKNSKRNKKKNNKKEKKGNKKESEEKTSKKNNNRRCKKIKDKEEELKKSEEESKKEDNEDEEEFSDDEDSIDYNQLIGQAQGLNLNSQINLSNYLPIPPIQQSSQLSSNVNQLSGLLQDFSLSGSQSQNSLLNSHPLLQQQNQQLSLLNQQLNHQNLQCNQQNLQFPPQLNSQNQLSSLIRNFDQKLALPSQQQLQLPSGMNYLGVNQSQQEVRNQPSIEATNSRKRKRLG